MVILVGPFIPLFDLIAAIQDAFHSGYLMRSVEEEDKEAAKIIARCVVAVSVSSETHENLPAATSYVPLGVMNWILSQIMTDYVEGVERVLEPARSFEIGTRVEDSLIVILNTVGKAALLRAGLVRNRPNLQLLNAYSHMTVLFSALQAVGYIVAVLLRLIQHVTVSPVEQIASLLSGVVILKCILHIFVRTTHHPLVLHLNSADQREFSRNCNYFAYQRNFARESDRRFGPPFIGAMIFFIFQVAGLIFFFYNWPGGSFISKTNPANQKRLWHTPGYHRVQFVPTLLFAIGIYYQLGLCIAEMYFQLREGGTQISFGRAIDRSDMIMLTGPSFLGCMVLSLVSYLFAVIVTAMFWHSRGYDVRTSPPS